MLTEGRACAGVTAFGDDEASATAAAAAPGAFPTKGFPPGILSEEAAAAGNVSGAAPFSCASWSTPPANPGSRGHSDGSCKPCNKFDPNKLDSCKHGDQCQFCHCQHDRPRHRGQRGRHAQQKRLFFEQRETHNPEIVELTNNIYDLRRVFEEIRRAINDRQDDREAKLREFMQDLRDIGQEAHEKRPDHERVRGSAFLQRKDEVTSTELDKRCKWLLGTLHLMLRKKQVAGAPLPNIQEAVSSSVNSCRALRGKYVTSQAAPSYSTDAIQSACPWLVKKLELLAGQMQDRGSSRDQVQEIVGQIEEACTKLFGPPDQVANEQLLKLCDSETLSELLNTLKAIVTVRAQNREGYVELQATLTHSMQVIVNHYPWLADRVEKLASQEQHGNSREQLQSTLDHIGSVCEELFSLSGKAEVEDKEQTALCNSESLSEVLSKLEEMAHKERLFSAQNFDDLKNIATRASMRCGRG